MSTVRTHRAPVPSTAPPLRATNGAIYGASTPHRRVAALQRTAGNRAVTTLLSRQHSTRIDHRHPEATSPVIQRAKSPIEVGVSYPIKLEEKDEKLKIPLSPLPANITGAKAGFSGTVAVKAEGSSGAGVKADLSKVSKREIGIEGPPIPMKGTGLDLAGISPTLTPSGKINKDGGELGAGLQWKGEHATLKLDFALVKLDEGGLKWATLSPSVEFPIPKADIKLPGGLVGEISGKAFVGFDVSMDEKRVAEYLARHFGPEFAAVAAPVAAGLAAAGFIAGTMYLMDDAHKRGAASGRSAASAGARAKGFSEAFARVATGRSPQGGPGAAEGAQEAEAKLKEQLGPRELAVEVNRHRGEVAIAKEAYVSIAQRIYDDEKIAYRAAHKDDTTVRIGSWLGVEDLGSGLGGHLGMIAIVLENKQPGGPPLQLNR